MGKVILIVDDGRLERERLKDDLEDLEDKDYVVVDFDSTDDAIAAIEGGLRYHIAVVDSEPNRRDRFDGNDVMRVSRRYHPFVPIISRSAYANKPALATVSSTKPDYQTIISTIEDLLEDAEGL